MDTSTVHVCIKGKKFARMGQARQQPTVLNIAAGVAVHPPGVAFPNIYTRFQSIAPLNSGVQARLASTSALCTAFCVLRQTCAFRLK